MLTMVGHKMGRHAFIRAVGIGSSLVDEALNTSSMIWSASSGEQQR